MEWEGEGGMILGQFDVDRLPVPLAISLETSNCSFKIQSGCIVELLVVYLLVYKCLVQIEMHQWADAAFSVSRCLVLDMQGYSRVLASLHSCHCSLDVFEFLGCNLQAVTLDGTRFFAEFLRVRFRAGCDPCFCSRNSCGGWAQFWVTALYPSCKERDFLYTFFCKCFDSTAIVKMQEVQVRFIVLGQYSQSFAL